MSQPEQDHTGDVANDVMHKVLEMLDEDYDLTIATLLLAAADLLGMGDLPGFDESGRAATLKAAMLASAPSGTAPLIRLVPIAGGVAMRFENTPRPMAERTVSSMEVARTFAIAMHECHGWSIAETPAGAEWPG